MAARPSARCGGPARTESGQRGAGASGKRDPNSEKSFVGPTRVYLFPRAGKFTRHPTITPRSSKTTSSMRCSRCCRASTRSTVGRGQRPPRGQGAGPGTLVQLNWLLPITLLLPGLVF